jgi:hypothetical protein
MDEGLRVVASNHNYMESMRRIHCPSSSMGVQTGGSADDLIEDIIATNYGTILEFAVIPIRLEITIILQRYWW